MSVLDAAQRLAQNGDRSGAVALVENAAASGDGEALLALANWRLYGLFGPADHDACHRYLDAAIGAGSTDAARLKAALLANGTGTDADEARALQLLTDIAGVDPAARRLLATWSALRDESSVAVDRVEQLSRSPDVRLHHRLLNAAECAYLIALAESRLQPSFVTNPATGRRMADPMRTSWGTSFGPAEEDLVVRRINARLARVSGTPIACGEPLQMLRYAPGQEYRLHTDSIRGDPNNRVWTVLVYLNEGYEGGETEFPHADLRVRGETGDALIFRNLDADGEVDMASMHAGLPVQVGVKWLATRWIRLRP